MTLGSSDEDLRSTETEDMAELPSELPELEVGQEKSRWYAVQVASGCEKRVKANLEQRVQTLNVASRIVQVAIPEKSSIQFRKGGKSQQTTEKVFPGYVLIRMLMDDETWLVVKNTPHVINFVGA